MTSKYVLVNIGCIECGVSSNIVGIFTDKAKAKELAEKLNESKASWRDGGQNAYEVFPTLEDNVIDNEYMEYLK